MFFIVSAVGRPFTPREKGRRGGFLGLGGSASSSSSAASHTGTGSLLGTTNTTSSDAPEATVHPSSSSGDDASAGKDNARTGRGGGRTDSIIVYTSSWISDLTGYPSHEFLGRDCRFLQGPATDRRTVAKIAAALNRNESIQAMLLNYRKDQTPFWNLLSLDPLRNRDGEVVATLGVQKDVTELVRLYLERIRAGRRAGEGAEGAEGSVGWYVGREDRHGALRDEGERAGSGGRDDTLRLTATSLAAHDMQVRMMYT